MKDVPGLVGVALLFLAAGGGAAGGGTQAESGYCIGNQCFSVVREPFDFAAAQVGCARRGGHLMTVRSSEAQDTLFVLLGNETGRFWIGLHLSGGCPAAAAGGMRGFQWVTRDNQSDFFNWAPGFDSSCAAHRCVTVSRSGGFQWTQGACGAPARGFLCEFGFAEPCKGLARARGEHVTYETTMGFRGDDLLSLPPGSIATRVPSGARHICFSGQWLQAPWSCEIAEGGCEHKCIEDPNRDPHCYCPPGQTVSPANDVTCEVVGTGDPCHALRCQHACYVNGSSHACMCNHGFKLAEDGSSCVDINDCSDQRQCPGDTHTCVNTVGGYQCVCKAGYVDRGGQCVDQDECRSAPCEHVCVNTAGSYTCSCYPGYRVDPASASRCKLHCGKEECAAECDPNDAAQCYCPEGYVSEERDGGTRTVCVDIDECESNFCDQLCENSYGDYECACWAGYALVDRYRCVKDPDYRVTSERTTTTTLTTTTTTPTTTTPDRRPSGVSAGGLAGIILCTTVSIVLLVFLAHALLSRRERKRAEGDEAHGLQPVTRHAC